MMKLSAGAHNEREVRVEECDTTTLLIRIEVFTPVTKFSTIQEGHCLASFRWKIFKTPKRHKNLGGWHLSSCIRRCLTSLVDINLIQHVLLELLSKSFLHFTLSFEATSLLH